MCVVSPLAMRSRALRRALFAVLALAGSVLAAWLAVRNVDLDVFWQALRESEYGWLVPATIVLFAAAVIRAERWRLTFPPESRPPLRATMEALLVGLLFNTILPARAGEAARIVVLNQSAGTSRAQALGTAVVERVYDLIALLAILFVATPFLPDVSWLRRAAVFALVLLLAVVTLTVVVVRYGPRPVAFLLRPLTRLRWFSPERVERVAFSLTQGFGALHRPALAVPALALTVVSWLAVAAAFWLVLIGFELGLGFDAAVLVTVATTLALVVPSLPAAVGVFEAAVIVALRPYEIGDSRALSYAVVLHAVSVLPYAVAGYVALHLHTRARRRGGRSG